MSDIGPGEVPSVAGRIEASCTITNFLVGELEVEEHTDLAGEPCLKIGESSAT